MPLLRTLCPSDAECAALAARLVQNQTWITPTLVAYRYAVGGIAPERLRFWPKSVRGGLKGVTSPWSSPSWITEAVRPHLSRLARAGMPLLAGSDADVLFPENMPGLSLHDELALWVQGGLPPLEALRTATLNPAKSLRANDSLGTVAAGKLADLVLLDADPLADIRHTTAIQAVVANGRYFDRAALGRLLTEVQAQGKQEP